MHARELSLLKPVAGQVKDVKGMSDFPSSLDRRWLEKTGSKKDDSTTKMVAQENLNPKLSIAPLPGRLRMYVPPANFGAVETNSIYRSGYPTSKNFDFINSLNIRTILYVSELYI
jgi:hypothetical protein